MENIHSLPIYQLIPELIRQLQKADNVILEAAPGAGKTTVVPLELMNESWSKGRKIVMLEPRRLAAKAAAQRLAYTINEPLGKSIGYRIRHEGKESSCTKVLVVTEGVLTRMLQDDPSLDEVALVIFDEFHERNIHSDLALSLCLQAREIYRDEDPLKLLVMSATLDTETLQKTLDCPVLTSKGRSFPITAHYSNKSLKIDQINEEVIRLVLHAINNEPGSLLVFLPGQKEIRFVEAKLNEKLRDESHISILPLYGELSLKDQQAVILPAVEPQRKIVLATSIAQTSLTIEGIRVVIDSGLSREARFDANTATTRLHTRRATQAETTQRMGRAGRTEQGACYRWWSNEQQHQLPSQAQPQIEISDLSTLAMDLAMWGVQDRMELNWITVPPQSHWQQAVDLLHNMKAIKSKNDLMLTTLGEQMSRFPIEPRLANILVQGKKTDQSKLAASIVTILSEGNPFTRYRTDLNSSLEWLDGNGVQQSKRSKATYLKSKKTWEKRIAEHQTMSPSTALEPNISTLLTNAFYDRIAHRTHETQGSTLYKLSNGRKAFLPSTDPCSRDEWLIVLEAGGKKDQNLDQIYLSASLDLIELEKSFPDLIERKVEVTWSKKEKRLLSESQKWIGKLCIDKRPTKSLSEQSIQHAVSSFIKTEGLNVLPWDSTSKQLIERLKFAADNDPKGEWPDCSDKALIDHLDEWLTPYLNTVTNQQKLDKLPLADILLNKLDWNKQNQLNQKVPSRITVPSGSSYQVDYCEQVPTLRVKLQEMFGCLTHPTILNNVIRIELLSPGKKPVSITQDISFFWQEAYPDVRKEMRGRYPKHPWPENPLVAQATSKTNKALRSN